VGTRSTAPEEDGWVGDWRGDESPRFQPPPGLHERLTHQLGADADLVRGREISPLLAQIEQRAAELETDNHRLRQQITQLNSDVRDLKRRPRRRQSDEPRPHERAQPQRRTTCDLRPAHRCIPLTSGLLLHPKRTTAILGLLAVRVLADDRGRVAGTGAAGRVGLAGASAGWRLARGTGALDGREPHARRAARAGAGRSPCAPSEAGAAMVGPGDVGLTATPTPPTTRPGSSRTRPKPAPTPTSPTPAPTSPQRTPRCPTRSSRPQFAPARPATAARPPSTPPPPTP